MSVSKNQPAPANPNPTGLETVGFTPQVTPPPYVEGRLFYDNTHKTITLYPDKSNVALQVGQEVYVRVINASGSKINNGQAVYISGANGPGLPEVSLAQANSLITSLVLGLATHDIEIDETGFITVIGNVGQVNTSTYTAGDRLFLSPTVPGGYTTTIPTGTDYIIQIGIVIVDDAVGEIQVQIIQTGRAEVTQAEIWVNDNTDQTAIVNVNDWEQIVQITQTGEILGWTHNGTGTLTAGSMAAGKYTATYSISSQAISPGKTYEVALSINDVIISKTKSTRRYASGDVGNQCGTGLINIAANDELKVEVRNITDDINILIKDANLNLHLLE